MATRTGRLNRFANALNFDIDANNYISLFASLFINSVKLQNVETKQRYIMDCLLRTGRVGKDKITGKWATWWGEGKREDGEPSRIRFTFPNGMQLPLRERDECVLFRANPYGTAILPYLISQAETLSEFDVAIRQNLDAVKQSTAIITRDTTSFDELSNANCQRRLGAATVHLTRAMLNAGEIATLKTGTDYLTDKLLRDRQVVLNNTLNVLGTNTGLNCKRERVQTAEIESADAYANDCISIMVDTFNTEAEEQGDAARMLINDLYVAIGKGAEVVNNESMDV